MHQAFADKAVPPWVAEVKKKYGTEKTKYACVGYIPPSFCKTEWEFLIVIQILFWSSICLQRTCRRHMRSRGIWPPSFSERESFLQLEK
jgi:hypothetical protein